MSYDPEHITATATWGDWSDIDIKLMEMAADPDIELTTFLCRVDGDDVVEAIEDLRPGDVHYLLVAVNDQMEPVAHAEHEVYDSVDTVLESIDEFARTKKRGFDLVVTLYAEGQERSTEGFEPPDLEENEDTSESDEDDDDPDDDSDTDDDDDEPADLVAVIKVTRLKKTRAAA